MIRPSVYYLYNEAATSDVKLCHELESWIYGLYRDERQTTRWHQVLPGGELRVERLRRMQEADVILVLLSADFLGLDDCHERALAALAERGRGAVVIPILLRPIAAAHGLPIGEIQPLPRNGVPISRWSERDDAWQHVCDEITAILEKAPPRRASPLQDEERSTIGQYRLLDLLGAGGVSEVYLAEHCLFARRVAIKLVPASPDAERLMRWEATILHAASHPGVVGLLDAGIRSDGSTYLILELLEGMETLDVAGREHARDPASWRRIIDLTRQVAETMADLHARGLVHGDLKPSNLMIHRREGHEDRSETIKIIDFAATRFRNTSDEGICLGTPGYMSPEQVRGSDVTEKGDVYALGATLFELCTGRPPFASRSVLELFATMFAARPPSVASLEPTAPPEVARLVDRMIAFDPDDRPTMRDVAQTLGESLRS